MTAQSLPLTLPDYIEILPAADDSSSTPQVGHGRYFLTLNRTVRGQWSAAYKEFENGNALCYINDADTLEEVHTRLAMKLKRYHKQYPDHAFVSRTQ
jgi:hypothetical protein